jgi:hypothetical protein
VVEGVAPAPGQDVVLRRDRAQAVTTACKYNGAMKEVIRSVAIWYLSIVNVVAHIYMYVCVCVCVRVRLLSLHTQGPRFLSILDQSTLLRPKILARPLLA